MDVSKLINTVVEHKEKVIGAGALLGATALGMALKGKQKNLSRRVIYWIDKDYINVVGKDIPIDGLSDFAAGMASLCDEADIYKPVDVVITFKKRK